MTGQHTSTDGQTVWLDDAPVDPAWAAPPEPDTPAGTGRRRRRLLTIGIPVLALLMLIGSVWALGGFGYRNDTATDIARGKTFVNGPCEFSFSKATVQETEGFGKYKRIQKVVVTGTIRNIGDKAISPDGRWFLARSQTNRHVETGQAALIGNTDLWDGPQDVTPGLPPIPVSVDFDFPPTFDGTALIFGVGELTYGTHSYFGGGTDEFWDTGNGRVFRIRLPLTRLAAQKS
ncbi:MAG: hypothetical protein J2P23_14905 [Microlunatus sp.]|nr:hypothetical protein [Microlunatus sp.]